MKKLRVALLICLATVSISYANNYEVYTIEIQLNREKAPATVANFFKYVNSKFYDGTIFHRVIHNFMIQGGGLTKNMIKKRGYSPIVNEAGNGLRNVRGTIAMARTSMINSATGQFFINVKDNNFLNHKNDSPRGYGYCVFGKVIKGMQVVDKIRMVTVAQMGYHANVPVNPVIIKSIRRSKKSSNVIVMKVFIK